MNLLSPFCNKTNSKWNKKMSLILIFLFTTHNVIEMLNKIQYTLEIKSCTLYYNYEKKFLFS